MASTFIRKDAGKLPQWDPTLLWYAKGIAEMQRRAISDPTSWRYQGAIHDYDTGTDPFIGASDFLPPDAGTYWQQCQHSSWYFLPWHRMYLGFFEQMVRAAVVHLGGPADWALPYWNYSDSPRARHLPKAFTAHTLQDGSPNPLFVINGVTIRRDPRVTAGGDVTDDAGVDISICLTQPDFEADPTGGGPGFGGPQTVFNHGDGPVGSLEQTPHGDIHMGVAGRGGWMGDFTTAALDPVFWLHHANIDRLWTVWKRRDSSFVDPGRAAWQSSIAFDFHDANGNPVTMTPAQVQDSTTSPFSYDYEDTSDPLAAGTRDLMESTRSLVVKTRAIPEMVGASEHPVTLTGAPNTTTFTVSPPAGPAATRELVAPAPKKTYLNIENVTGQEAQTGYLVYVNLPPGANPADHKDLLAGSLSMFGVSEATSASGDHPGTGLHYSLDISRIVEALTARDAWNDSELRVSFVPRLPPGSVTRDIVEPHPPIRIGRVSLYHA